MYSLDFADYDSMDRIAMAVSELIARHEGRGVMADSYLKQLGRTAIKGSAIGIGLGVSVYGLMLLSYWMGWLEKTVCK
jgi:hypothetical protein